MQPTPNTHHLNVGLGGQHFKTQHAYTVEQAKEINHLINESARLAMGCQAIQPQPLKLTAQDGSETVLDSHDPEPFYAPGTITFGRGVGTAVIAACVTVSIAAFAGAAWMIAKAVQEVVG